MQNQIPLESLPDGTVVKTTAYWFGLPFTHYGVKQRTSVGGAMIHHNSKRIGKASTTDLQGFSGGSPVFVHSIPQTIREGWVRAERARADVERGIQWTVVDNCEDFISRAVTGHDGSPTRSVFVGAGLLAVLIFIALKS